MWARFCLLFLLITSSYLIPAAAQGRMEDLSHLYNGKMEHHQANEDNVRRLASLKYDGEYSPSSNADSSTPLRPSSRRRLLQDYSPMANSRTPSIPSPKRKLLQDYNPTANERSPPPPLFRKLLQDYSPTANQRSPSVTRRLLQDYSPMSNQRVSSSNNRKL